MLTRQYRQRDIPENNCNPVWSEMSKYIFVQVDNEDFLFLNWLLLKTNTKKQK